VTTAAPIVIGMGVEVVSVPGFPGSEVLVSIEAIAVL
jgi:hypothetical protein